MGHTRNERYTRIRTRAAEIWLQEGCPGDQQERHWLLALREIDCEDASRKEAGLGRVVKPARIATPGAAPIIRLQPKARAAPLRSSRI